MPNLPHIVIVGGGAGGLEFTIRLAKQLVKKQRASITLVDKSLTHLWKPLLHEVAAGTLDSREDELNYIAHASIYHFNFRLGEMTGLNRAEKKIYLAPVFDSQGQEIVPGSAIKYDILVVAVGSTANDFNIPGVKEYCYFLDNREQADQFQQQFIKNLMHAQNQQAPLKPGQLDIAIIGGGATGVELAAELHYTIAQAVAYGFDRIDPKRDVKLTLIEAADRILAQLPKRLSSAVTEELKQLGVTILTQERVTQVTSDGLNTANGKFIPAMTKVWAAGIIGPDFLKNLDGLAVNKFNQLLVTQTLQTTVDPNIFAFGDCAACPQPNQKWVPPRAQAAHQQAKVLTKSIINKLKGKKLIPYVYHDYGSLISLSRHAAFGNLMGRITGSLFIEGKIARMVYLALYKGHQIAVHGSWRVFLMTLANLLTKKVKPRLKLH